MREVDRETPNYRQYDIYNKDIGTRYICTAHNSSSLQREDEN